ncbi:hypothetical protein BBP00_00009109 [Phytophthora kernoviae]|uniref:Chloride channel protein n=1 Tax=Phytophthora kernoviae TaxID=325452 RepID=A0A3F2RF09_9STRA|nr:hypothetical protein BBP00_00009109 [Phytophthora kernoviae]
MAAVYMFLLPLCITLKIPTGIWVPTFIAGAAIGRMFGEIIATLLPRLNALPGAYALAGAAAYGTAATRAISVVVITLEITAAMSMILPLFCASLAAMAVSNLLKEKSVYDTLLVVNGMPFLPLIDFESTKTAGDIVEVCLVYLTKRTTIARVLLALQRLPHHEIPVVDDETTMVLLGVVSGSQLRRFVRSYYEVHRIRGVDEDLGEKAQKEEPLLSWATIKDKLTFKVLTDNTGGFHGLNSVDITYNALTTQGPHNIDHLEGAVPFLMDDEKMLRLLNEGWDAAKTAKLNEIVKITEGRICTIRPMAMTISSNTPLDDLHMIFTMLRCDHCFVCDHGALEGVVTTKGLLRSGKYSTAASELSFVICFPTLQLPRSLVKTTMRLYFVLVIATTVLASRCSGVISTATDSDSKATQVASADSPLRIHLITGGQSDDNAKTRSLRSVKTVSADERDSTGNDEERAFNALQAFQDLLKWWQAQQMEKEYFMKLIESGEKPSTLYRKWGLDRINERIVNDKDFELWLRFREHWRWVTSG